MQLMKITISVNDKELLSFDILLLIVLVVVYLFYLSLQTFYNIDEGRDTSKSVTENNEDDINEQEMKINDDKDDNDLIIEKSKGNEDNTNFSERNENEKRNMESKLEKQQTQTQVKKEEEWMVIRKGKKVKSNKSKN
jgi:anionic cell wall polymer biosynthesis LytR-Cps2A-Psr (LCP) family protein